MKMLKTLVAAVALMVGLSAHAVEIGVSYAPTLQGVTSAQDVTRSQVTAKQDLSNGLFVDGSVINTQTKATNALRSQVEANLGYAVTPQCYVKAGVGESLGVTNAGYYQVATGGAYAFTQRLSGVVDVEHRHSFTRGNGQSTLAKVGAEYAFTDSVNGGIAYVKTYGDTKVSGLVASVSKSF